MNGAERIRNVNYGSKYIKSFRKLPVHTQQGARDKEKLFRKNPFSTQLETHKLHGKFQVYWAYSVDHKYRVIFRFINAGGALFFDIGLHQIYGQDE